MQGQYSRMHPGDTSGSTYPRFYVDAVLDQLATSETGRPIFHDVEMVEILMPGIAAYTVPVEKVGPQHIDRWPREYEAFKNGLEMSPDGTPLEEWPRLRRGQVMELKALEFRTVEDVARMSDTAMQRIGMGGSQLRDAARAFLNDAEAGALTSSLQAKLDRMEAENAALKRQVGELDDLMRQMHANQMQQRNAPHPIATTVPGMMDPMQAAAYEAPAAPREAPQSSLSGFVESRRRPGRPRREVPVDGTEATANG